MPDEASVTGHDEPSKAVAPDLADLVQLGIQPDIAAYVRRGPHDPDLYATWIGGMVDPAGFAVLVADPANAGLHVEDPEERARLLRRAAWAHEMQRHERGRGWFADRFIIRDYGGKARVGRWDDRGRLALQSFAEFENAHADRYGIYFNEAGAMRRAPAARAWLRDPTARRYDRVEFLPDQTAPSHVLNLWRGWPGDLTWYRPDPNHDRGCEPERCARLLEHMRENMCGGDEELLDYLLGWWADLLQNPARTSEVAVVLRGPQGSGKTLWAKLVAELLAPHTLVLDKPNQLVGNFNSHLLDKLLVFADEAFFAGNRQHANTLKTLVTSDELIIEPKGVDSFMARKMLRLIIASNDEHVVRADMDDRRFLVLEVNAGARNQNREYFGAIVAEWRDGGRRAMFEWLRGRYWRRQLETGAWEVGLRPRTRGLELQKDLSLPPAQRAIHNMLREGEVPCDFDARGESVFVATNLLADARRLAEGELRALGDALRVLAGAGVTSERRYLGAGRDRRQHRGFWLPALAECRRRWESHLGRPVDWPADVSTWATETTEVDDVPF